MKDAEKDPEQLKAEGAAAERQRIIDWLRGDGSDDWLAENIPDDAGAALNKIATALEREVDRAGGCVCTANAAWERGERKHREPRS